MDFKIRDNPWNSWRCLNPEECIRVFPHRLFNRVAGLAAQRLEKIHDVPGEGRFIDREVLTNGLRHEKRRVGLHQNPVQRQQARCFLNRKRFFIGEDPRKGEIDVVGPRQQLAGKCGILAETMDDGAFDSVLFHQAEGIGRRIPRVDNQRKIEPQRQLGLGGEEYMLRFLLPGLSAAGHMVIIQPGLTDRHHLVPVFPDEVFKLCHQFRSGIRRKVLAAAGMQSCGAPGIRPPMPRKGQGFSTHFQPCADLDGADHSFRAHILEHFVLSMRQSVPKPVTVRVEYHILHAIKVTERTAMKKILLVLVWAANLWAQGSPADADAWKPLRFLIGTWEAKTEGGSAGAAGAGNYTFQLELRNHILSRQTAGAECKGPEDFNCGHSDLLYIYQDAPGKPFRAIFFDNEGHVIHYDVSTPDPASVVFLSDSSQPGPQYRLSYELKGGIMFGKFEMRMSGQTGFTAYLQWSGRKKESK